MDFIDGNVDSNQMTTQGSAGSSLACPNTTYCTVYLPEIKTALTVPCNTGRINAVIAEQRGSLTTEESIRIPLKALGDHSLSVRTTALQDIRNILHHHRAWLGGLLPANTTADGAAATGQQTELLSGLLGALLKCCDPEVGVMLSHPFVSVQQQHCRWYCCNWPGNSAAF